MFFIRFVLYLPEWANGDKNLCSTLPQHLCAFILQERVKSFPVPDQEGHQQDGQWRGGGRVAGLPDEPHDMQRAAGVAATVPGHSQGAARDTAQGGAQEIGPL